MTSSGCYGLIRAGGSAAIDFWDLQLGQRLRSFMGVRYSFLLSEDGSFPVAGMSTGHIDKGNMTCGIRERSLKAHSDRVEALNVAPGNSMVGWRR